MLRWLKHCANKHTRRGRVGWHSQRVNESDDDMLWAFGRRSHVQGKFDLLPLINGSNFDLGAKTHYQSRVLIESNSPFFFARLYDAYLGNAKGVLRTDPPPPSTTPCAVEDGEMASAARVKHSYWLGRFTGSLPLCALPPCGVVILPDYERITDKSECERPAWR